ncbi:MarR family winged helix-turn-helix transcriptional regulator [Cupriavidus plantarum]|uniref:MarR family winged helix-turn-helix transcriptional regulator n=1 Tax=Cupriavidus plantarum TaxID=942865 RepID=UPI000EB1E8D6|nr:MarR family transcriptional regulator [Cupriavidus plantarum]RLK39413.1 MarR family transcriptional regulator [Cupriavidus plantarum]
MDHYTKDNFQMTKSVGFQLNRARNSLVMELDGALQSLDITAQQIGILLSLTHGVASTPYELCKILAIDTGLMTRMLDKLEKRGLLCRSRSLEDRRVVNLAITEKGREVAARIPDIVLPVLNHRLRDFTPSEFDEFLRLLHKFNNA